MITPISHPNPVSEPSRAPKSQPQASKPASQPTTSDTVQLSSAARIVQEATETPAQTTREANTGDLQAKRLLAREAAERASTK